MKYELKQNVKIGPREVDLLEGRTNEPSNKWLLMFFGTGELGPPDASQLNDMLKGGYQKNPSFETEWNILAPQAYKSYSEFDPYILKWMTDTYGEDIQIVLIGHSLGGRNVMEYVMNYNKIGITDNVKGAIPIAGEMSYPLPADPCSCADIPVVAFHGDQDGPTKENPYNCCIAPVQSAKFVSFLNACPSRKNKAFLRVIPGKNHGSIMSYVFDPNKESEGYKTIRGMFSWSEQPLEIPGTIVLRNGEVIAKFPGQEFKLA